MLPLRKKIYVYGLKHYLGSFGRYNDIYKLLQAQPTIMLRVLLVYLQRI